jgi:hypothetical protein
VRRSGSVDDAAVCEDDFVVNDVVAGPTVAAGEIRYPTYIPVSISILKLKREEETHHPASTHPHLPQLPFPQQH